ncbi:MAG: PHP domain-containing protein [Candidatus Neomarinimicrobiota bacterium]
MKEFNEYIGCIHVHTVYSDGSGTFPEIIRAAEDAGLDYLMVSDHQTLRGRAEGYTKWHDDLFVSVGYEIQDSDDKHHYLVFGLDEILPETYSHQEYIKAVHDLGILGIAAHPLEQREKNSLPGFPAITWSSLDYPEIEVVEIWNMMSHWLEATTIKNKYWNVLHPRSFSTSPAENLLEWWDKANLTRKVVGIGSVDVHATKVKVLGIFSKAIFDYKIMFKSIRTHILSDLDIKNLNTKETESELCKSIKSGRCFISNFRRGDARGFRFYILSGPTELQMGDTGGFSSGILIDCLPRKAFCKVFRDGEIYHSEITDHLEIDVPEGIYRVEVERGQRGWIYSNHIKLING